MQLTSSNFINNSDIISSIREINQKTLPLIQELINFKTDILNRVLHCELFTANYPLLISYIINEAKMYYQLLSQLEQGCTSISEYDETLFWDNIMKEHAEFIRGLLDPSEQKLIETADNFAYEYEQILQNHTLNDLKQISLNETMKFKAFKEAGENGILNCGIKSIIVPLLADHILREANHFIRILKR